MRLTTTLLLFFTCLPCYGQMMISGEKKAPQYGAIDLVAEVKGATDKTRYNWSITSGKAVWKKVCGTGFSFSGPPGEYRVRLTVVDFKAEIFYESEDTYTIDGPVSPPKPPEPPRPPEPPTPPIPVKGPLTVLIVYESGQTLTASQNTIIYGKRVRDALKAKCAADPRAGDGKAYRIWDKDLDVSAAGKTWVDLMSRPRTTLPWMTVASPSGFVYEGPLPASADATVELLNKLGP